MSIQECILQKSDEKCAGKNKLQEQRQMMYIKKFSPFTTYTEGERERNLNVELGIRCEVRNALGKRLT